MTSRDYLRTPSTMNNTDCSQDSINPLDYSKINQDGVLNLSKSVNSPPTLNSQDENNNGRSYGESTSASPSTLVPDNFSPSSSLASTNKLPAATKKTSNKAITSSKRNKSFVDKSDDSVAAPVPPKKAMIKSVEKERIAVNRMENIFDFIFLFTFPHENERGKGRDEGVEWRGAFNIHSMLSALASVSFGVNAKEEMINCSVLELNLFSTLLFSYFVISRLNFRQ